MANQEHFKILIQGEYVWNNWRLKNPDIAPDLSGIDLHVALLIQVNFSNVHFLRARITNSELPFANFNGAFLKEVTFRETALSHSSFRSAVLTWTDFSHVDLEGADFTEADMGWTTLGDNDLSEVRGLDTVKHLGPSILGIETIYRSKGNIPDAFLRGCGLSDWQIENAKLFQPELNNEEITNILYKVHDLRAHQAIQINPLFISYSHKDSPFVDKLEKYLNEKGIRFWRDIHHATAGRLETQIDRAIRLNPTVLLVLSSNSVKSDWVQHEAYIARALELETKRDILCPVALDDSWKTCRWPKRLREQIEEYHILNFSEWKNEDSFRRMFNRLLEGLDLFYK